MLSRTLLLLALTAGSAIGRPQAPPGSAPPPGGPPPGGSPPPGGAPPGPAVTIVKSEHDNPGDGTFKWSYELSDGSKSDQMAHTNNRGTDQESIAIEGSYSYVDKDGKTYMVSYKADEGGFQPVGDHIAPAIVASAAAAKNNVDSTGQPGAPAEPTKQAISIASAPSNAG